MTVTPLNELPHPLAAWLLQSSRQLTH
jgi:hypothetical protein